MPICSERPKDTLEPCLSPPAESDLEPRTIQTQLFNLCFSVALRKQGQVGGGRKGREEERFPSSNFAHHTAIVSRTQIKTPSNERGVLLYFQGSFIPCSWLWPGNLESSFKPSTSIFQAAKDGFWSSALSKQTRS